MDSVKLEKMKNYLGMTKIKQTDKEKMGIKIMKMKKLLKEEKIKKKIILEKLIIEEQKIKKIKN